MLTAQQMAAAIVAREGDVYINDPNDRGGPTKCGVTLAYLQKRPDGDLNGDGVIDEEDVKLVTPDIAERFFIDDYLVRPGFNRLVGAIQPVMFDMAVNHGPKRAAMILQKALGIQADGDCGPGTVAATVRAISAQGFPAVEDRVVEVREAFYNAIVANDPSQAKYRDGWLHRAEQFRV